MSNNITAHWPDFFVIGAPKSGTTSLAAYLADHPTVSFSRLKEPFFFSTDLYSCLDGMTSEDYLSLFPVKTGNCLRGEASSNYMFSVDAVPNILAVRPDARFIAILRNPVDAAYAFYSEAVKNGREDARCFEDAWRLQDVRRKGLCIPAHCKEPKSLMYQDIFSYGRLLERLLSLVPHEQVKIFIFEHFVADPANVYRQVLTFLDLQDDKRTSFSVHNPHLVYRSKRLYDAMRRPHPWVRTILAPVKTVAGSRYGKAKAILMQRIVAHPGTRQPLQPSFRRELMQTFKPDLERLAKLVDASWASY
jgi:sulfotransferase family protein